MSLKEEFPFLANVSSVILQQTLRDQQDAFKNFWAGRAKYPKSNILKVKYAADKGRFQCMVNCSSPKAKNR